MEHKYKEFSLIKSAEDAGTISGYFSTYDRIPDSYGDVIAKGAFTETIQKRKESGHPFPLCWNHDLNMIIGSVDPDDIKDTDKGPLMTASFFDTPLAQEKRALVLSGCVYQFSFAYEVKKAAQVELEDGTIITGKTTDLLGPSAACILKSIRHLAGIPKDAMLDYVQAL